MVLLSPRTANLSQLPFLLLPLGHSILCLAALVGGVDGDSGQAWGGQKRAHLPAEHGYSLIPHAESQASLGGPKLSMWILQPAGPGRRGRGEAAGPRGAGEYPGQGSPRCHTPPWWGALLSADPERPDVLVF